VSDDELVTLDDDEFADGDFGLELPTLRSLLQESGVDPSDVDRAERTGVLGFMAIDRFSVPDPPRYDLAEAAEATGMDARQIQLIWRSLGLPVVRPGEVVFTDVDVETLSTVNGLMELGLIESDLAVQMSRVIGWSLARVAAAMVDSIDDDEPPLDPPGSSEVPGPTGTVDPTPDADPAASTGSTGGPLASVDDEATGPVPGVGPAHERSADDPELAVFAGTMLPTMDQVVLNVWRRHLQIAARRRIARELEHGADRPQHAVGFADMVGYTTLSQQVDEHTLAGIVQRFEEIAYDIVTRHGGRVVKMIGDEVMYVADDPEVAVRVGLDLAAEYAADSALSDVRVGIACGPVIEREADLYGSVVNLASRIVHIAFPGSVVTTDDVHAAAGEADDLVWKSLKPRRIKDIGRVPLWAVHAASADDRVGPRSEVRERRTAAREERLAALEDGRPRGRRGRSRRRDDDGARLASDPSRAPEDHR